MRPTQRGHRATATLLCSLHCKFNKATSQGSTDQSTGTQEISAEDLRVKNFSSNKEMSNLRPRKVRSHPGSHNKVKSQATARAPSPPDTPCWALPLDSTQLHTHRDTQNSLGLPPGDTATQASPRRQGLDTDPPLQTPEHPTKLPPLLQSPLTRRTLTKASNWASRGAPCSGRGRRWYLPGDREQPIR